MWGVYPEAIDCNIELLTHIIIWAKNLKLDPKEHFQKWGHLLRFLGPESVFWNLTSDKVTQNENSVCIAIFHHIASG